MTCKSAVLTHTQHEINMKRWGFYATENPGKETGNEATIIGSLPQPFV